MTGRASKIIASCLLILAVIGFSSLLFTEPSRLLQLIFMYGLLIGGIYAVYHFFFKNKIAGTDRKYAKAVKQSVKRQKLKQQKTRIKAPHLRVVGSNPHKLKKEKPLLKKAAKQNFTVIEGKKNKKKNRALF